MKQKIRSVLCRDLESCSCEGCRMVQRRVGIEGRRLREALDEVKAANRAKVEAYRARKEASR